MVILQHNHLSGDLHQGPCNLQRDITMQEMPFPDISRRSTQIDRLISTNPRRKRDMGGGVISPVIQRLEHKLTLLQKFATHRLISIRIFSVDFIETAAL